MDVRLTDGTTTLTLTSGAYEGVRYSPVAATVDEALTPGVLISESIWIRVAGTASEIQAARHAIGRMLSTARRWRESGRIERVYIEVQSVAGGDWYRSPIAGGTIQSDSDPMLRRMDNGTNALQVELERAAWWEGPSTAITWGSGATSTATISNGDGSPYNAADVTSGSVGGELPAPLALRIKNAAGTSVAWREFHVANLGETGMGTNEHIVTAATAASSWTPYSVHTNLRWICSVSDAVVAKCQGMPFRVVATFVSSSASVYYRAAVYANIGGTYQLLANGPEVYAGDISAQLVLDLGVLPIPPGGEESATSGIVVVVSARHASAGSATLDHVQLLPAGEYVRIEQGGYTTTANHELVLDEVQGRVYYDSGTAHYNIVTRRGRPLVVVPGRANRIAVLYRESSGYTPARSMTLSGTYRPRRLSV